MRSFLSLPPPTFPEFKPRSSVADTIAPSTTVFFPIDFGPITVPDRRTTAVESLLVSPDDDGSCGEDIIIDDDINLSRLIRGTEYTFDLSGC